MSIDEKYLPNHYIPIKQPFFKGKGELNIKELEDLCELFSEYIHQQQIIKHKLLNELKK